MVDERAASCLDLPFGLMKLPRVVAEVVEDGAEDNTDTAGARAVVDDDVVDVNDDDGARVAGFERVRASTTVT